MSDPFEELFNYGERLLERAQAEEIAATTPERPLWPHQIIAVDALKERIARPGSRSILQMPTAGGKTRIAVCVINWHLPSVTPGENIFFCVPRKELIDQTVNALYRDGITHVGVIQGQHHLTDSSVPVQVCTMQTLQRRKIPKASIVFVDECHLRFQKIDKWLNSPAMRDIPVIGLSATPWSKGLGLTFHELIKPTSISALIESGHLCPFTVFAPPGADLSRVRTSMGDFKGSDLSEACDTVKLCANVIETWQKRGQDRQTLLFGIDRKHAKHLEERFNEASIACEYIDGETLDPDRKSIFKRFESGETRIIASVQTIDTGVDLPVASCIIDARPTKSVMRYVQTIGRGLRIHPGKERCIILDHAGNATRLGLVTDIDSDVLDDGHAVVSAERAKDRAAPDIILCPECHAVLPNPKPDKCPQCAHVFWAITPYQESDDELVELGTHAQPAENRAPNGTQFIAMVKGYAVERGWHNERGWKKVNGFAFHKFNEKFGREPDWDLVKRINPIPPDLVIRNWIRSRQIAFARARQADG